VRFIRSAALALAIVWLFTGAVQAQSASFEPHQQGGVTWVSGGVGEQELQQIRQMQGLYNLHLLFALQGSGEYLAGIPVTIADGRGTTLVSMTAEGPYLFAKLRPGRYKITAEHDGQVQTRTVSVPASGAASQPFYWRG
jgi:hypothetical protein